MLRAQQGGPMVVSSGGGNGLLHICMLLMTTSALIISIITLVKVNDLDNPAQTMVLSPSGAAVQTADGAPAPAAVIINNGALGGGGAGAAAATQLSGGAAVVSDASAGRDEYLQDREVVMIAVDITWSPYCFQTTKNGPPEQSGFLVDVTKKACELANLDCRFVTDAYHRCWAPDHHAGDGLRNQNYDICLCWLDTYAREQEVAFPHQMTNNIKGGLLALTKNVNNAEWRRQKNLDGDLSGAKIGIIKGWATSIYSFNYILDERNKLFNKDEITFIDEQVDDDENRSDIDNINHLAAELMNGNIDFGYAMENTIEDHKTQDCEICAEVNQDIWKDGTFTMAKTGLKFAAAGASGMLRKDRTALIRQINIGIDAFIADKAKYCPLCKTYWPLPNTCRSHCIECTDFCD